MQQHMQQGKVSTNGDSVNDMSWTKVPIVISVPPCRLVAVRCFTRRLCDERGAAWSREREKEREKEMRK